jgi:hypothetical protein
VAERAAIGGSIALAAYLLAAELLDLPRPDILLVAICAAAFACGRWAPALIGGACTAVILAAGLPQGGSAVPLILATAAPWLAGSALRSRSQVLRALRRRTRELEASPASRWSANELASPGSFTTSSPTTSP